MDSVSGNDAPTPGSPETGTYNVDTEFERRTHAVNFSYRELAKITKNFELNSDAFLGNGRFGSVFRGEMSADEVLAVKRLYPLDLQSQEVFMAEVLSLSQLSHPNLANIIGYCAEGSYRLFVSKYMPLGSLERHLHDLSTDMQPLSWNKRIEIAAGIARAIDYLHQEEPSISIGNLKLSNILLDKGFNPKLSDFGLANVCQAPYLSTEDMGTNIYRARECNIPGRDVTSKSDVYSFGVILLEIISGCKAYDKSRGPRKASIVKWLHNARRPNSWGPSRYMEFADPKLNGDFPENDLCMVASLASLCVRDNPDTRPTMKVVVSAINTVLEKGHGEYEQPRNGKRNYTQELQV